MTLENQSALYLESISVSFDGFKALNSLSIAMDSGELRAIIGPNGAGKSTMMDVVTGKTRPSSGVALLSGIHDLLKLDEVKIANLGVGRKFQKPSVIESLTVRENLELAFVGNRSPLSSLLAKLSSENQDELENTCTRVGLSESIEESAGDLSHGQKQWLEIGMLLLQKPTLLLVDEPAAGMTDTETMRTADLLKSLAGRHTVVVVEHDMDFVEALECRVSVLHEGTVIAEGSHAHVSGDSQVIEVYLGR